MRIVYARARVCSPFARACPLERARVIALVFHGACTRAGPAASFCRSEYYYWTLAYISAPINMEMRRINRLVDMLHSHVHSSSLVFNGLLECRPNDRLMTLGNKVQSGLTNIEITLARVFQCLYFK